MGTQGLDPVSIEASALLRCGELPRFDLFDTDQVVPSIRQLLGELASALDALEARVEPTWEGLVLPLERMNERLAYAWGLVSHMLAVRNSDALRTAHETVQGEVIAFGLRQAQSPAIHDGLQRLRGGPAFAALDATQQRIVDCLLRDARHSGVGLEPAKRARFNEIQAELAQLGTRFNNHVLDATRAFSILVRDPAEMAGTPPSLRALTAQNARENGEPDATAESGPWRLSLDAPVLIPFLEHGASRPLRERLYRANIGRAASGELDNTPVLEGILALRQEMARLLGFASYAELSLDAKMAPGLAAVDDLLERLRLASIPGARADLASVQVCASGASTTRRRRCGRISRCRGCSMDSSPSRSGSSTSRSPPPMARRPSGIPTSASSASATAPANRSRPSSWIPTAGPGTSGAAPGWTIASAAHGAPPKTSCVCPSPTSSATSRRRSARRLR
jgi:oligopeptidase A